MANTRFQAQLPKTVYEKKNSASKMFMKQLEKGKKNATMTQEERYHEILIEKTKEIEKELLSGINKYSFNLLGTDGSQAKAVSKSAQAILDKIAEKRAKRLEARLKKPDTLEITPKFYTGMQGGRVDAQGYIYDSAGQWILTIDKKTGKVKNRKTGTTVCKFKPGSPYSDFKIAAAIAKYDTTKQQGWWGETKGLGDCTNGVWEDYNPNSIHSSKAGSFWGGGSSKGGNIWGTGGDDKGGGWW